MTTEVEVEPVDFRQVAAYDAEIVAAPGGCVRVPGFQFTKEGQGDFGRVGWVTRTEGLPITPTAEGRGDLPRVVRDVIVRM